MSESKTSITHTDQFLLPVSELVFTDEGVGVIVRVVSASDVEKIENWSCKQSQNGSFFSDSAYDSNAFDEVKTGLSES